MDQNDLRCRQSDVCVGLLPNHFQRSKSDLYWVADNMVDFFVLASNLFGLLRPCIDHGELP